MNFGARESAGQLPHHSQEATTPGRKSGAVESRCQPKELAPRLDIVMMNGVGTRPTQMTYHLISAKLVPARSWGNKRGGVRTLRQPSRFGQRRCLWEPPVYTH